MASNKILNDKLREVYLKTIMDTLASTEEVLRTGTNEFAIPCLDEEQNEKFIVVTVKVPTGSRDGDEYDGYSVAQEYELKCKLKAETVKKKAEEKAKKIERDKKKRNAKNEKVEG